MIRSFLRWLRGYVKIRVEGYSPERFLNLCCFHHILIWELSPAGNAYEMYMSLSGFRKIRPFARKTRTRAVIIEKCGFPFFVKHYRRRKLLFAGIFFCIILLKAYSLFIWDIHFEGNEKWTDETLIEFLASNDITPFMLKSRVDCSGIVKDIRKEYNDIVWVSASVDGSRLKIQIKENEDTFTEETAEDDTPVDLIAGSNGVITGIVTRAGVPQVHVGDEVKAGDLLVSGRIDVLDDSGEVTGYQYQHSDADIYADTEMEYNDSMPLTYQEKIYDGKKRYRFYVNISGWELSAGTVKNRYPHADLTAWERQIKLGENFYLPLSYGYETAESYSFQKKKYTEEEIRQELTGRFEQFCRNLEEKGIQIRENSVKIHMDAASARASGILYLNQKIAEETDTEILTIERKEELK